MLNEMLQAPPELPSIPEAPIEEVEELAPIVTIMGELADQKDRDATVTKLMDLRTAYGNDEKRAEVENEWLAIERAYLGLKPPGSPFRIQYSVMEIFRQIETLKPQMHQQFFGQERRFKYAPRHPGAEGKCEAATAIVHDQIERRDIDEQYEMWLDAALMYGTSYITQGWRTYRNKKRTILKVHDANDTTKTAWERTSADRVEPGPYCEFLKPWEVYSHPYVEHAKDSPAVFVEQVVSSSFLKTCAREGWLDAEAVEKAVEDGGSTINKIYQSASMEGNRALDTDSEGDDAMHVMLTCWTNDSGGGHEYVILNEKTLCRAMPLPDGNIPILDLRNYPQAGLHHGIGEPLIILDEQRMLNDFMSMYVEGEHYTSVPMFVCSAEGAKALNAASFQPGGKIILPNMTQANGANHIYPLPTSPKGGDLTAVSGTIRNNMKLSTGLNDQISGTGPSGGTATVHVRLQDAAGVRLQHKARTFSKPFKRAYRWLYELNAEHLSEKVAIRMEGEDGKYAFDSYDPDVFAADIDVEIELANQLESQPEIVNKWQQSIKLVGADPLINRQLLYERMFRGMGEKKPKIFINNPATAQTDALKENQCFMAYGAAPDPNPADNHIAHWQIHNLQKNSPEFAVIAQAYPAWAAALDQHMAIHADYIQTMQQQQAQMQQAPMGPQEQQVSPVNAAANARTEGMFDNGATGAGQVGGF